MLKIVLLVLFIIGTGIALIRTRWARSKNSNQARQIIDDLKSGKHNIESYEEAFSALITSIPLNVQPDERMVKSRLEALCNQRFHPKFSLQFADINHSGKGILIGEAKSTDFVQGYGTNQEISIHLPCWLLFRFNETEQRLEFRSLIPESKDHHFLLEDFARLIYERALRF